MCSRVLGVEGFEEFRALVSAPMVWGFRSWALGNDCLEPSKSCKVSKLKAVLGLRSALKQTKLTARQGNRPYKSKLLLYRQKPRPCKSKLLLYRQKPNKNELVRLFCTVNLACDSNGVDKAMRVRVSRADLSARTGQFYNEESVSMSEHQDETV